MHRTRIGWAGIAAALLPATIGMASVDVRGISEGQMYPTFRVYLESPEPGAQLLAVLGTKERPLDFQSLYDVPLANAPGPFAGTQFDDFPFPGVAEWDSWVTIGSDTPVVDVAFTTGAFGSNGFVSVIHGSSLFEADGGWYDTTPEQSPVTGERILIAQVTTSEFIFFGNGLWRFEDGREELIPFDNGFLDVHGWDGACCLIDKGELVCESMPPWHCWSAGPEACFQGYGAECGVHDVCGPDRACCPFDVTFDQEVGYDDVMIVLERWGHGIENQFGNRADVNYDQLVDFTDLLIVLSAWGPCE